MSLFGRIKAATTTAVGKPAVESTVGGAVAAGQASLANVMFFGGFGVLSAVTNQIEYINERADIANFYREEIASKTGKSVAGVTDEDLSLVEKGDRNRDIASNKVIGEAVGKERGFRNLGVATSFVASLAVFALMETLGVHVPMDFTVAFAGKVAVSVITYMGIKAPLTRVGAAVFGLNKKTTHEKIQEIAKDREEGKAISREQVVEIFVSANKALEEHVKEHFGRSYDELALADKVRLAAELSNVLPIDKITHNINLGATNAAELAFTVQGDMSGVLPKAPKHSVPSTAFGKFADKCKGIIHSMTGMFGAEKADPIAEIAAINSTQQPPVQTSAQGEESPIVEMNEPNFRDRVGRGGADHSKGHVEQLAERRAQQVMLAGSNTLQ